MDRVVVLSQRDKKRIDNNGFVQSGKVYRSCVQFSVPKEGCPSIALRCIEQRYLILGVTMNAPDTDRITSFVRHTQDCA